MAIPSRQIGWGTEENLLYEISKQLEYLIRVVGKLSTSSVDVYSEVLDNFPITYVSVRLRCNGSNVETYYTPDTANSVAELASIFNTSDASALGTFSDAGDGRLKLTMTGSLKNQYCSSGTLTLYVFSD